MLHFIKIKLNLVQKLIGSFAIVGVCLITAVVYAVIGLDSMHRMVDDIARNDLAAATATIALRDAVLAQQRAAGRFMIFRQPEFKEIYDRQSEVFRQQLDMLRHRAGGNGGMTELTTAYTAYESLNERLLAGNVQSEADIRQAAERVEKAIEAVNAERRKILKDKLSAAEARKAQTSSWALGLAFSGITLALLVAVALIYSFSKSINKLQKATHRIADGDFDHDPHIPPGDEIGSLAQDFMRMAVRLKELEQISLDASPLTRLPGNIAIERSINRRLRERTPFVMCYLDLDNFKSYNDRYGYIKASEILRETGQLIYDVVASMGDPDAFVGHIGGDDYVVIINASLAKQACQAIISKFDAMVPSYYSVEDQAAGAIEGIDRYGVARTFPLLSMSIAALNCQPGTYTSAAEIATAAAAVKDRVKETSGSNYIIVREAGHREA